MLIPVPRSDCTGAREAVSARLDGELSELEDIRLDTHLRACAECRAYTEGIEVIAATLRAASLDQPQIQILLPRRSRLPVLTAAACFVLLAAVGGSSVGLDRAYNQDQPVLTATTSLQVGLTGVAAQNHLPTVLQRKHLPTVLKRYELRPAQHSGDIQAI